MRRDGVIAIWVKPKCYVMQYCETLNDQLDLDDQLDLGVQMSVNYQLQPQPNSASASVRRRACDRKVPGSTP